MQPEYEGIGAGCPTRVIITVDVQANCWICFFPRYDISTFFVMSLTFVQLRCRCLVDRRKWFRRIANSRPTLAGLQAIGLDLSPEEELSFGQTSYRAYFDAVLQNTGLPDDLSLTNADFSMPDGVPTADRVVLTVSTVGFFGVPGLHHLDYSSGREISDADAQADILATVAKYCAANGLNTTVEPVFLGFNNHAPFELTVPAEAIRNGYYKQRNALQGRQNTWYTGAAWQAHDSTLIWNFTETAVVQELVKVLCETGSCD